MNYRKFQEILGKYEKWWLHKTVRLRNSDEWLYVKKVEYIGNTVYGDVWLTDSKKNKVAVLSRSYMPTKKDVIIKE